MGFNWLHLSDIHFEFSNYDTNKMRKLLNEYLVSLNTEFHFLLITGDISYKNKGYDKAYLYINELCQHLHIKKLYIVPGNHDLERGKIRSALIDGIYNSEDPIESADNMDEDYVNALVSGQNDFFEFYKQINNREYPKDKLYYIISGEGYNIAHINTCLLAGKDNEEGKLIIPLTKLDNTLADLKGSSSINIAIAHHTIDCIDERIRDKYVNCLSDNNIDILLCGHVHKPKSYIDVSNVNTFNVFVSGSGIVDKYAFPYFTIGKCERGNVDIIYHKWNKEIETWAIANDVSRKYTNGIIPIAIERINKEISDLEWQNKGIEVTIGFQNSKLNYTE